MTAHGAGGAAAVATARSLVMPLASAQSIASYAASNMNVAISTIADDLDTDVTGIQSRPRSRSWAGSPHCRSRTSRSRRPTDTRAH